MPLVQNSLSSLKSFDGIPYPNISVLDNKHVFGEQLTALASMTEIHSLFTKLEKMPKYVIINFPATDGSAHSNGAHSNQLRKVLEHLDKNIGVLFNWLKRWDIYDKTAIIFTSDHGHQFADPTRASNPMERLEKSGFKFQEKTAYGIYFNSESIPQKCNVEK